jgi:ATP-dependent exoDNAse (exonuclease V) alpha subunit
MKNSISDNIAELAAQFINSTSQHIFLTGKAGTGKTTFLKSLREKTHKKFIVVAPTGIAALNAGGVTIHSQFLFPLGSYVPDESVQADWGAFFNNSMLARKNPLNSDRKKVLREIDLLVIDEVSMLRADILDAIDYRLRAARGNYRKPFGGVQLLLIGDLFQLPPIVRDREWGVLQKFYSSIHFFESLALKKSGFVYLELDKVFRQADQEFIDILNRLRTNKSTEEDINALNKHYGKEPPENAITLCTHNAQADKINAKELESLNGKSFKYEANVEGDFPEKLYPIAESMELKVGARVMFIKNDNIDNLFYNGKLATVTELKENSIKVDLDDEDREIEVERMNWTNSKFTVNADNELEEEVLGTFSHFPLKYAWAVTVHKSQGLTFDKAIIDVGRAFAPGQVYVALSRLRSLEGLHLRTKIHSGAISGDHQVTRFSERKESQPPPKDILERGRQVYLIESLDATFDFDEVCKRIDYVFNKAGEKARFSDPEMNETLVKIKHAVEAEKENTIKFRRQLHQLVTAGDWDKLLERVEKGAQYYRNKLFDELERLLKHIEFVRSLSKTVMYLRLIEEIDHTLMNHISKLWLAKPIAEGILQNGMKLDTAKFDALKKARRDKILEKVKEDLKKNPIEDASRKVKKKAVKKGATYQETYRMLKEGMKPDQIAVKRSLAETTIWSHVAKGIKEGILKIDKYMGDEDIAKIREALIEFGANGTKAVYEGLDGEYDYHHIRMVVNSLQMETEKD